MQYLIDIVGTCNLRCPSCPLGNVKSSQFISARRPKGFMDFELFSRVLDKAEAECKVAESLFEVYLYNWGEPLIHPKIAEFVTELSRRRIRFFISTNLNTETSLTPIVRAGPAVFRISLSGFSKAIYSKGHVDGDPNLVISNMYRLRHAMDHCKSKMAVHVYYHVYQDNCQDDILKMAELSDSLGFYFSPGWAYFMGLEKLMAYVEGKPTFTPEDQETLRRTVLSLDEAIAISQQAQSPSCSLQTDQMVINHDGSVALCCAVFDPVNFIASDFLGSTHEELQERKRKASLCTKCMANGLHDYAQYNPNTLWDDVAFKKQIDSKQTVAIKMFSTPHIYRQKARGISGALGALMQTLRK